jgi:RHS repeat-associated protein
MKKIHILSIVIFGAFSLTAQTASQNYVKSTSYKVSTSTAIATPTPGQANVQVMYYDGLGRPIQKVDYQQSELNKSIVTPMAYDSLGRMAKEYLPFVREGDLNFDNAAVTHNTGFYSSGTPGNTGNPHFETTSHPYSEKQFERSPLGRVLKQSAPGDDWAMDNGHEIKFDYPANVENEVYLFHANTLWNSSQGIYDVTLDDDGYYGPGTLYKTITFDENWTGGDQHTVQEFKDKDGRIILKRTFGRDGDYDTYYVYDIYGNLSFVIPPLADAPTTITPTILDGLCYQYRYDARGRLAEKKLPGKQWEFIVYDKLDRPVLTGPANNPFDGISSGWLYTKYDVFGRICITGWLPATFSSSSRYTSQATYSSAAVSNAVRVSSPVSIDGVDVGYSSTGIPSGLKLLTVNYYDDYDYPDFPGLPTSPINGQAILTSVKGLQTGNWVRVLKEATDEDALRSYTVYDQKSRPIVYHTDNHLGGYTTVHNTYDFAGQVLKKETAHKRVAANTEILTTEDFTYSDQGRLITHMHTIYGEEPELLVHNTYDELGNLIVKNVGGNDTSSYTGLQHVDYQYNVRGWLREINDVTDLTTDPGRYDDLFGFKINYNQVTDEDSGLGAAPLYNGNIAQTYWRSASDNIERKYCHFYDPLNRLTDAKYQRPESTVITTNSYDENLSYDKGGNIQTVKRNGNADAQYMTLAIDDLLYEYSPANPNRLMKVTDLSNYPLGFKDDSDGTNDTDDDYSYDDNGNMIADANKGIDSIYYNHMNLPLKILFSGGNRISYIYDATGKKIHKEVNDGDKVTTDYLDGFQYKEEMLQFFGTAEGYVNYLGDAEIVGPKFNYVYNYLDHLGNIRLTYGLDPSDQELKIIEENHYYPFGLKHKNYNSEVKEHKEGEGGVYIDDVPPFASAGYKYKYNGKELQDELGLNMYDYGAMMYDPAIGRRNNIDPYAELNRRVSPYSYAKNNPLRFVDPDGMLAKDVIDDMMKKSDDNKETKWTFNDNETATSDNGKSVDVSDENTENASSENASSENGSDIGGDGGKKGGKGGKGGKGNGGKPSYTPPPKDLPDGADRLKPKGGRPRYRLPDGDIIEWDGQHGEWERYNPRGKHTGVLSPDGELIKDPVPGRKIDPTTVAIGTAATVTTGYVIYKIIVALATWECGGCGVLVTP